ncbi:DUF6559 family protein [Asticcacaulis endophyticus]|uniref:Uncharacterized protein n=1 Tax=Asticcacaulis endophyticus TaxID=1395890 RepID=A0A918PRL1_9CAUL|nr:DUF6559 family protein [Asticcacaulis endophyticus]GGZ20585.1 hypothetical protein GCM10011273_01470 [Asticcacaulis endophyticus]
MGWFERFKWHRAAKKCARQLPRELAKGWGRAKYYTLGQIETAFKALKLPDKYSVIAYAAFLTRDDFDAHVVADGPVSYEVALALFERFASRRRIGGYWHDPHTEVLRHVGGDD